MRGEFVDVGGVRMYCYASGSRGAGAPLVLVHGAFTSSHLWKDLIPRLPSGHRVLVIDLLGHGRSDPPQGAGMTVSAHSDRLTALLDIMGVSRAALVGHGMGASIVARVAALQAERVAQLALINPTVLSTIARASRISGRVDRLVTMLPLFRRLPPDWLASALHHALLPAYAQRASGAHALDLYLAPFRTRRGRDAACEQLRGLAQSRSDGVVALAPGAIRCETALVLGVSDPLCPPAQIAALEQALNTALHDGGTKLAVHRLAGVAHVAPEEAPDRLGAVIAELLQPTPLPNSDK